MNSEVRPPYISRTISSRPSRLSAPRKNLPSASNHCGPIGRPSGVTTSRSSSPRWSFCRVCDSLGPVGATLLAQIGAARTKTMIRMKSPRKETASLLRMNLLAAMYQGLRALETSGVAENAGSRPPATGATPGWGSIATSGSDLPLGLFLEFVTGQILKERRAVDDLVEFDVVGDKGVERPRSVRRPGRFFHHFFVEFSVGRFLFGAE